MESIVNKAKTFEEADNWDIQQHVSMTPENKMNASHFSPDTLEFLRLLFVHKVQYVIVGGEAVIFYGYARLT